jgi:MATE family, multidrug efflux pump
MFRMALTKYPEGSIRELLWVAFPLMLSSLSTLAMVFVDRLFLGHLSPAALSAAVTAGTMWWAITGALLILASMSEVFVAQYNGAGLKERIGRPVWQMIWFSVATLAICIPLGLFGGELIFHDSINFELENTYFSWLNFFGPTWPLSAALAAFWVGRGKTRMVTALALLANGLNVLLDWILIFGIEGVVPSMGVKGAAIATSFGNIVQVAILLSLFLHKSNREAFGTSRFKLHFAEFRRCLKVGGPQATLFFIEAVGWSIFYILIRKSGPVNIYTAGITQSVLILFFFIAEGIGRGASAITGNMIGGGRHGEAFKVFFAGLKLHFIFFVLMGSLFFFFPDPIIDLFVNDNSGVLSEGSTHLSIALEQIEEAELMHVLRITFRVVTIYLLFEGIRWLISGILTSAGDTLFLLIAGTVTVPICLLLPMWYFVSYLGVGVIGAYVLSVTYVAVVSGIFYWRFAARKWQKIQLISSS